MIHTLPLSFTFCKVRINRRQRLSIYIPVYNSLPFSVFFSLRIQNSPLLPFERDQQRITIRLTKKKGGERVERRKKRERSD